MYFSRAGTTAYTSWLIFASLCLRGRRTYQRKCCDRGCEYSHCPVLSW